MEISDQFSVFMTDVWSRMNKMEERALAAGLESDISITEINIISKIAENPDVKMSDAARLIGVTLATLTVACDKLEAKGLVERSRDSNDRRVVKVAPTAKGLAAYTCHRRFHAQLFEAVLGDITPEEEKVLSRCVQKLVQFMETHGDSERKDT